MSTPDDQPHRTTVVSYTRKADACTQPGSTRMTPPIGHHINGAAHTGMGACRQPLTRPATGAATAEVQAEFATAMIL
jgi:hypothetical protein